MMLFANLLRHAFGNEHTSMIAMPNFIAHIGGISGGENHNHDDVHETTAEQDVDRSSLAEHRFVSPMAGQHQISNHRRNPQTASPQHYVQSPQQTAADQTEFGQNDVYSLKQVTQGLGNGWQNHRNNMTPQRPFRMVTKQTQDIPTANPCQRSCPCV